MIKYTNEDLIKIAQKFETKKDLRKYNPQIEKMILEKGIHKFAFSHMRISNKKLTKEYLMNIVNKYDNAIDLRKYDNRAYRYLVSNGKLKSYTKHYKSIRFKHTFDDIKKKAQSCNTVAEFRKLYPSEHESAKRQRFFGKIVEGMSKKSLIQHSLRELRKEAKKYKTRTEFSHKNSLMYHQAKRKNLLDKICSHMTRGVSKVVYSKECLVKLTKKYNDFNIFKRENPNAISVMYRMKLKHLCDHMKKKSRNILEEDLVKIAKKYKTRSEFSQKDHASYVAASRRNLLDKICSHMKRNMRKPYTKKEVLKIARKYKRRSDFLREKMGAYNHAYKNGYLNECFKHMMDPDSERFVDEKKVYEIAKKYKYRSDFYNNERAASEIARKRGIIDSVCSHMDPKPPAVYKTESKVRDFVKSIFSDATKKTFTINVEKRPYIRFFELDVYVPSLNKAIEFDGAYWHSTKQLLKNRRQWPISARKRYHQIKDEVFLNEFGIKILHISDTEWFNDEDATKEKIKKFLIS